MNVGFDVKERISSSQSGFLAAKFDFLVNAVEGFAQTGGVSGTGMTISASLGRSRRACVRLNNIATRRPRVDTS
jgi:hypothetical protein